VTVGQATPHRVVVVPGDGIGPEVVAAAVRALEATGVAFEWDFREAGAAQAEQSGSPLPPGVVESIAACGVALKGPTATPAGGGFRSVNLLLREQLGLHASIRPCRAYPGAPTRFPGTDLVVIRMNQEDLYAGIEFARGSASAGVRAAIAAAGGPALGDDAGISIKPLSAEAVRTVARLAFEHATASGRSRVTAVHKATVMRATDGLFLEAVRAVARDYPGVALDDRLVDSLCHDLVVRPEGYDVLLMPVLYGDIVSDLAAGLVGGLGLAPSANVGERCAVFEAVHGTAPRRAGQGRANPMALMLCGVMLLRHLGEREAGDRLEAAIAAVLREGRVVTYDLKPDRNPAGAARTDEVAKAVAARLG
jgi:isocitrate dehydrogenase (NAD+)